MADIPACIPSEIAEAALTALRGRASLIDYLTDEAGKLQILDVELEEGFVGGGFATPSLLVAIDEVEETPQPSGVSDLTTVLKITLVTALRNVTGSQGFFRARLVDEIKAALFGDEFGMLRNGSGDRLTEAIVTFQRVGAPVIAPDNTLRTPMRVGWTSTVLTGTREQAP